MQPGFSSAISQLAVLSTFITKSQQKHSNQRYPSIDFGFPSFGSFERVLLWISVLIEPLQQ
jgi:hypothetical protein